MIRSPKSRFVKEGYLEESSSGGKNSVFKSANGRIASALCHIANSLHRETCSGE